MPSAIPQLGQACRRRRECPALARQLAANHQPRAGDHRRLMHVEAGNPFVHDFHYISSTPSPSARGPLTKRNLTSVLRGITPVAPVAVFKAPRVQLAIGLFRTMERRPLADGRPSYQNPPPPGFIQGGRPSAGGELAMTEAMSVRLDNLDRRVARIERRLELVEAPTVG